MGDTKRRRLLEREDVKEQALEDAINRLQLEPSLAQNSSWIFKRQRDNVDLTMALDLRVDGRLRLFKNYGIITGSIMMDRQE